MFEECQIIKIVSQQKPNVPKIADYKSSLLSCHIVTEGQWIGHNREHEIFRKK